MKSTNSVLYAILARNENLHFAVNGRFMRRRLHFEVFPVPGQALVSDKINLGLSVRFMVASPTQYEHKLHVVISGVRVM